MPYTVGEKKELDTNQSLLYRVPTLFTKICKGVIQEIQ